MRHGIHLVCLAFVSGLLSTSAITSASAFDDFSAETDWQGAYAGILAGYAQGISRNAWTSPPDYPGWRTDGDIAPGGAFGGVLAGYQIQHGGLVWGAEGDASLAHLYGDDAQVAGAINRITIGGLGTLRARIGIVHDNLMIFGTGGLAVASFLKDDPDTWPATPQLALGWAAGAGVEYALDDAWRVRAEYLHVGLGEVTTELAPPSGIGYVHRTDGTSIHMLRAGVSRGF